MFRVITGDANRLINYRELTSILLLSHIDPTFNVTYGGEKLIKLQSVCRTECALEVAKLISDQI